MIKVMIVDDEPLVRIGLKSLINWEENGFRIEAEAANGKEAWESINICLPDIVLTDIKMPIMGGIELIKNASLTKNKAEFIVLSCFSDFEYVKEAMKLGAIDYLIKSDITPKQLLDVLLGVKQKIDRQIINTEQKFALDDSVNKSMDFLKEDFLRDLLNGVIENKNEIMTKKNFFKIRLCEENLVVIKIMLDNFADIRKVYTEKDDRLLRLSFTNILEESIPAKFKKEIVVKKSDEFIIIINLKEFDDYHSYHKKMLKLCKNLITVIKDYLNISIYIGISNTFNGVENVKKAYDAATKAAATRFFTGKGHVAFSEELCGESPDQKTYHLDQCSEKTIRSCAEAMDRVGCIDKVSEVFHAITMNNSDENAIRKMYLRIIEIVIASLPNHLSSFNSGSTPYEEILALETLAEINDYTVRFIERHFITAQEEEFLDNKSYVEQAMDIIKKYYYEDISLQSVADKIKVNPSYLSRIFKQATGENFINFVTKVRINKAKHLLESKKFKVYEVAEKVGYQNHTYFSKIFKKVVGLSPEEFK